MHRGLKNRHIQMISLGSAIGTGLFLVSGATIQTAGPIVLLGYALAGSVIFLMMRMLGEMAVARPVSGSWSTYAREYLGKPAGFIAGWNWWFTCIVVSMLELTAAGVFMDFWFPNLPHWVTAAVALAALTAVNLINVKAFGEFEFWFTLIKVAAVLAMIVLGVAIVFGAGSYEPTGLSNLWSHGGFAPTGLGGFMLSLVAVTFTFGGITSLGTAAGETTDPARTIPRAINQVIVRILVFYVGAIGVMLIIWPWDKVGTEGSPFVLMLVGLGVGGAATLLNIIVLTAVLSVLNTMTYSNARVLHGLAEGGQAPAILARTNSRGVPVVGLLVNSALVAVVVVLNLLFPGRLLMILVAIILSAELITWGSVVLSHLRFRNRFAAGAFKAPLYPIANYACLAFFALVLVLMTRIPDFRTGAIAFPLWLGGLTIAAYVHARVAERRAARVARNDRSALSLESN
jgi:phenylalanine-specific permease